MGKLGKIFGILVVVLAIAAAVLSFMLSQHRAAFRNRAADLAEGVSQAGVALSKDSGKTASASFTAASEGGKESGTLAWEEYKNDAEGYKGKINQVVTLASEVTAQRDNLAAALDEIGKTLNCSVPMGENSEELKNLGSYSEAAAALTAHAREMAKRDKALCESLEVLKAQLKAMEVDLNAFKKPSSKGYYNVKPSLHSLENAASLLAERCNEYESCFEAMIENMNQYDWNAKSMIAGLADNSDYKDVLNNMKNDALKLNAFVADLKAQQNKQAEAIDVLKVEISKRDAAIASLKDDLSKMTEERDDLKKRIEFYSLAPNEPSDVLKEVKALKGKEQVDKALIGKVLNVDADWNFVVIDLGKDQVVPGLNLAVNSNGNYVATVKVTKSQDRISLAEVVSGRLDAIKVGSVVFFSGKN